MQHPIAELSWDDVRVLLALARSGTLAGAARQLGVDKATVSRRLAALERALSARLFLRTREGLKPSAEGERLLPHAEAMERAARGLRDAGAAAPDEVSGVVRLATTEAMASRLVSSGLLDLCVTWPRLELELLGGNRPVDLLKNEADLALRVSPPEQRSLKSRVVARLGFALFASPGYLRQRGTPASAAQLSGHDVLVLSGELARLPEAKWLSSRPGVRVKLRSSSMGALLEAARAGHGLCVLTKAWGDSEAGVDCVLALPNLAPRPVWLLTHPELGQRRAVKVVADRVAELMRNAARA